jgi:hypothetical protein
MQRISAAAPRDAVHLERTALLCFGESLGMHMGSLESERSAASLPERSAARNRELQSYGETHFAAERCSRSLRLFAE